MNIILNVNELVEQIQKVSRDQSKALSEYHSLKSEVEELRSKIMDYEMCELKAKYDKERDLDDMSKHYESLENNVKELING